MNLPIVVLTNAPHQALNLIPTYILSIAGIQVLYVAELRDMFHMCVQECSQQQLVVVCDMKTWIVPTDLPILTTSPRSHMVGHAYDVPDGLSIERWRVGHQQCPATMNFGSIAALASRNTRIFPQTRRVPIAKWAHQRVFAHRLVPSTQIA